MAKHVGVSGIYERLGKEIIKKSMVGQDGSWKQREHASPFQEREDPRDSHPIISE
jgi:hypothetical protein